MIHVVTMPAHDGLRSDVRDPGSNSIILAQLWYEHEYYARKTREVNFLSQVVASPD